MREVNVKENKPLGEKKKKVIFATVAVISLLILFFLSFITAYNIMTKNAKNPDEKQIGTSDEVKLDENKQLKEKISALEVEVEELKAQVDKYKAIAGASAVPFVKPSPTPKPSAKPTTAPSDSQDPNSYSTSKPPEPAKTPARSKVPVPTETPVPTVAPENSKRSSE